MKTPEEIEQERQRARDDDALLPALWYSVRPTIHKPGVDLGVGFSSLETTANRGWLSPRSARDLANDLLTMLQMSYEDADDEDRAATVRQAKLAVRALLPRARVNAQDGS